MSGDPFTLSVKIPARNADLRRVALTLFEAAIDRILAVNARRFEQSLIDNDAPSELLADLLLYEHDYAMETRARIIEKARGWLVALDETVQTQG
jgi:hypothetical protein